MREIPYLPKNVRFFLVVLLALAVVLTIRKTPAGPGRWIWIGIEAALTALFFVRPRLFFPVYRLLLIGSSFIGRTIFLILSFLVFFLFLTPFSGLQKLFGKALIPTKYDPKASSYFEPASPAGPDERQY
ncbi:MAG: hypothetical protein NTW38_04660 [Candidatus Aminicenantes bacterium]|nr:hypothetical protein [Candidatus Aminicenantes bacterium]